MEDKQTYITKIEGFLNAHGEDWHGDRKFFEFPKDEYIHIVQQHLDGYIHDIELMYDDEGQGIPELYFCGKTANGSMFTIDDEHLTTENIETVAKAII